MTQPITVSGPVIVPPDQAAGYLARMDVDVADIHAAVANGEVAATTITGYHPHNVAGLARWIAMVGSLRRRLDETGRWSLGDAANRPVCRHRTGDWSVAVVCGDAATGDPGSVVGPRAARRKGAATARAVREQESLIPLTDLVFSRVVDAAGDPPPGNWIVLYHRGVDGVRLELSLPLGFDEEEGQFTGWAVRVLLDDWVPETAAVPRDVPRVDLSFHVLDAA
ncbi:hypothetical protein [Tsukamurella soli]|uniref:Uncharacterized protein n=1 Tax=Tsukamurella soli TaxID=644556 RepID=A0ABP8J1U9_9ACTN